MNYSRRQLEAFGEPFGDSCTRIEDHRLICGGGGKGGGGKTQVVQKADPWKGVQPFLTALYPRAEAWFRSPAPQFFPGATVAGQAPETLQAQQLGVSRALQGSPLQAGAQALGMRTLGGGFRGQPTQQLWNNPWMQSAAGLGLQTMGGGFLGSNPFLESMYRSASDPMVDQFSRAIVPAITSQFAQGGRYGSGLHQQAVTDAAGQLADALGGMGAQLYGGTYESERERQQQALGQGLLASGMFQQAEEAERMRQQQMIGVAPELAGFDYNDINMLARLGGQREALAQELLNADIARWDFGQNQPLGKLQALNQILAGGVGAGGTSSKTTQGDGGSPLGGMLGGAMLGYQALPALASTGLLGSTAAASEMMGSAGINALGGMSLGPFGLLLGAVLGGLMR